MKTFTNCAEKKAKQILNLLQGYTKGIRMTVILVILLMGVSNVWGGNNIAFQSGAFFYFDPYYSTTQTVDKGYIQLAARKYQNSEQDDYGWYTAVTTLTKITNTRLYYTSTFEGPAWTDSGLAFHGWAMISNSTAKGNGSTEYWTGNNSTWYSEFKNYGLNKNSTYLFVATSASKGQSIQPNGTGYLSGGYSALNSTQTIKTAVNGADANSKATITVTSYKLTGNGAISTQQSASISTSAKSTTISAARTATTTLTVGSVATGYKFDGWYTAATGGTQLSTSTTYIYYPTEAKTVYARFSEITYSVQVKSADNNQGTVSPTSVNAGQFTGVTITATPKIGYSFANWTATDGITITNPNSANTTIKATKAGTVTANFEEKPATTIYLEPTGHWNSNKAVFQAHVWQTGKTGVNLDMVGIGDPSHADGDNKSPYRYYKVEVPYGYDKILFFREDPANKKTIWNQTGDLTIPTDNKTLYVITNNTVSPATGEWKEANLVYTITLGESKFGPYGIKYNGQSYFSHKDKDVDINVPYGATITFIEGQPYSDIYTGGIMQSAPTKVPQLDLNQPFTVLSDVTFDDNYVTKVAQVAYLGVPNGCDWDKTTTAANANFTWRFDSNGSFPMTNSNDRATTEPVLAVDNVKYYKFTIPAGCNKFQIQRKQARNDDNNNQNETFSHTCDHEYMVLNTGINCYMLDNGTFNKNTHTGHWCALPASNGDFRVLYVEQEVANGEGSDSWKTVINTTYQHSSDFIRKNVGGTDIVSLHVKRNEELNPEIILQQMKHGVWVDLERHMVMGPLQTDNAGAAMLPGRRNAAGNLIYDDGIEVIKNDGTYPGRVYNFKVQQFQSPATTADTAKLLLGANDLEPYKGNYYIRTDNAVGGWICYNQSKNVMSHSLYSLEHSGYSHYFCKWVELKAGTPNVKFVVANQYGAAISDIIVADDFTDGNGTLEADANVRWMWNEYTNIGSRAYIAGSTEPNFLVAKYAASSTKTFTDKGEWVYEADLTDVKIDDKLTSIAATYAAQVQELLEKSHVDAGGLVMLASAGNDARVSSYTVRIVYDFKINQTICYLIPTGTAVATSIDVIIERINQDEAGQATQVTAAITPANAEGLTVYGLITLTKAHITGPSKSEQEALTYWISFPFDVKIGDITGFGEVGKHWMIKYYDGAERAEKGWFLDTKTFWKFFLDTENVMRANRGYVLTLNKSLLNASNPVYDNTETLRLYFPSMNKITTEINSGYRQDTVHITEHWCNITSPADRTIKDSHWNLIGVPSFANKTIQTTNETVKYFYDYSHKDDKYNTAQNAGDKTFKPMHAYMVQFAGVIDWNSQAFNEAQQQLAAKKNADAEEQYTLRLELQQNGTKADQTFVELQDDATTMFDMNIDLTKMFNAGANIYTIIGDNKTEAAANVLPIANTVIPVGVQIATAGEYTFAMPDGTEGIVVELIDYETNTTTNLMLDEYTVNLAAGTNESRFALSVKPDKTATSLENININSNGVKKYLIDGVLYLQKDGLLYDAQGKLVR